MTGIDLRLRRLGREGLYVIAALDHGVSMGPVRGLSDVSALVRDLAAGGATGVVLHKGLVARFEAAQADLGLLLHVSASTSRAPDPDEKRIVATAEEAVRAGADGVSVHTNLGSATEAQQVEDLSKMTTAAHAWGLPALSMMYPRGPSIKDPYEEAVVAHAARLAGELGADLVKTLYTGSPKSFRNVTSAVGVPVLVAGGAQTRTPREFLEMVHGAMQGGAAGVSVGRNLFESASPRRMTEAVRRIVIDGARAKDALQVLKSVKV